ncbi:MAG: 3-deoxy-D-manno-octulosonic acid kinase [Gammaproteobacteria bacterium]
MQLHEISEHNTKIWVADHVCSDFQASWFEAKSSEKVGGWQSGRQSIARIELASRKMVLRHYCRGGVPARFSKDKFIFRGYLASRPYRELVLLQTMYQQGLPVPEPIASRCIVNGVLYHADILMSEIVGAKTLAQIISNTSLEQAVWEKIGQIIRRFHQQGIQHVDLNANNILLNESGDVYLIDFDRCVQRTYSEDWARAGIERLKRSLSKQKQSQFKTNFHQDNFDALLDGYQR